MNKKKIKNFLVIVPSIIAATSFAISSTDEVSISNNQNNTKIDNLVYKIKEFITYKNKQTYSRLNNIISKINELKNKYVENVDQKLELYELIAQTVDLIGQNKYKTFNNKIVNGYINGTAYDNIDNNQKGKITSYIVTLNIDNKDDFLQKLANEYYRSQIVSKINSLWPKNRENSLNEPGKYPDYNTYVLTLGLGVFLIKKLIKKS
ncbi:hypothetical protein [Mycoplasma sp. 1018B]|uniref:hypothetical protein n=1 Tax=Mycoplasma sp. 1018B TaxID=2967302 RepID=UPI00211C5F19|nr:hypothetical protein [Mycoplasma sp. 1018B]UUM19440.1 hypothetical protein NPA14_01055 [Mycoplasma sp. 1018B]